MRQFDVFANPFPRLARQRPYLIILQHDRAGGMLSVVVAPCAAAKGRSPSPRLSPIVTIGGDEYLVIVTELASVARAHLSGRPATNLAENAYEIQTALDLLLYGV